jgi:two-component system nitrate/nitrite response regulator NarL
MNKSVKQPIRVMIVCQQRILRAGLCSLIGSSPGLTVVAEASLPLEAIRLASLEQPDVVLLDLTKQSDQDLNGFRALFEAAKSSKLVVLADPQDHELPHLAVRLGATGVVLKDRPPEILIKAIEKVHAGEAWIDRLTVANVLTELYRGNGVKVATQTEEDIETLTQREREVVSLVALGLRNKQIADRLFISDITVRHHLTSTFSKLGVSDRFELMIYAYRHRLADLPSGPVD